MKVNFYNEIEAGFELIKSYPLIADDTSKYMVNFKSVILEKPYNYDSDYSAKTRYDRKLSVYKCILKAAGFKCSENEKVTFSVNQRAIRRNGYP